MRNSPVQYVKMSPQDVHIDVIKNIIDHLGGNMRSVNDVIRYRHAVWETSVTLWTQVKSLYPETFNHKIDYRGFVTLVFSGIGKFFPTSDNLRGWLSLNNGNFENFSNAHYQFHSHISLHMTHFNPLEPGLETLFEVYAILTGRQYTLDDRFLQIAKIYEILHSTPDFTHQNISSIIEKLDEMKKLLSEIGTHETALVSAFTERVDSLSDSLSDSFFSINDNDIAAFVNCMSGLVFWFLQRISSGPNHIYLETSCGVVLQIGGEAIQILLNESHSQFQNAGYSIEITVRDARSTNIINPLPDQTGLQKNILDFILDNVSLLVPHCSTVHMAEHWTTHNVEVLLLVNTYNDQ